MKELNVTKDLEEEVKKYAEKKRRCKYVLSTWDVL